MLERKTTLYDRYFLTNVGLEYDDDEIQQKVKKCIFVETFFFYEFFFEFLFRSKNMYIYVDYFFMERKIKNVNGIIFFFG